MTERDFYFCKKKIEFYIFLTKFEILLIIFLSLRIELINVTKTKKNKNSKKKIQIFFLLQSQNISRRNLQSRLNEANQNVFTQKM